MGGSSAWSYLMEYLPWELRSNVGELSHMMAATKAQGGMLQHIAAKRKMVHEDANLSPKVVKCSLPRIISRSETDTCHPVGYSCYWSNTCFSPETRIDLQGGEFSPKTHATFHSELDECMNARFSKPTGLQSLAAESASITKTGPGLISAPCEHYSNELELEWQFIVDPMPKSALSASMSEQCKEEEDVTLEEALWCDAKHNGLDRLPQEPPFEFETCEVSSKPNYIVGSHGSHYGGFLCRQQLFALNGGAAFQKILEDQDRSCTSSLKSLLRKAIEKDDFIGQATQDMVECQDNCSFCCPKGRLARKAAMTSFDLSPSVEQQDVSQNPDKNLLSSPPYGNEFKHLESTGHMASSLGLDNLDPSLAEPWDSQRFLDTQTIHSINGIPITQGVHNFGHSFSSSSRNSQFTGGDAVHLDQSSVLFAEALCHSQTRARKAEEKVQQTIEEKEQLMHFFFKEAYLAFTYRQWVSSFQSENMWLSLSPQHQPVPWLQHSVFNPFSALERLSSAHWKTFGHNHHAGYHRDQNIPDVWHGKALVYLGDPNEIVMGYTLAFALGLSLAGAGLVLGWSMGWILLSY